MSEEVTRKIDTFHHIDNQITVKFVLVDLICQMLPINIKAKLIIDMEQNTSKMSDNSFFI